MRRAIAVLVLVLGVVGCDDASPSTTSTPSSESPTVARTTPVPTSTPSPRQTETADPRWQFFTSDHHRHTSPWFAGSHRIMIGYGCNAAPWYSHDPRCPGRQGFHHGIDVAMACGTPLFSAVHGFVLDRSAPGSPGAAYGRNAFRIRSGGLDILIGHTPPPSARPGERVRPGQPIAKVGDSAAPDGCHLHFEVRRAGGGLSAAVDPTDLLRLG